MSPGGRDSRKKIAVRAPVLRLSSDQGGVFTYVCARARAVCINGGHVADFARGLYIYRCTYIVLSL